MKTLLTIYIVFAWSALFGQVNNPYDLSPTNRNHRERKSFQVGDLTGNDSLVGVGAVVYFVKGSGVMLFDSTQFIISNDTIGISANVSTSITAPLLSITAPLTIIDADTITIANQYISSVSTGNVTFKTTYGGSTKILSLSNVGINLSIGVDSLNYISGVFYDTTGSNVPFVEMSIFDTIRQEDVASIQAKYPTTHPHLLIQLLDISPDTVEETTIHQHGELLFENMSGFRFKTNTTNFIVPKVQGTAGQVLSLTNAVTGATGWVAAGTGFTIDADENMYAGTNALDSLTTGTQNFAAGIGTLLNITNEADNTALGYNAGNAATGSQNVFIGHSADGGTGTGNTVVGYLATSGNYNGCIVFNGTAGGDASIAFNGATTAANQVVFGSISDFFIGSVEQVAGNITLNVSGSSGTNQPASNFIYAAGIGTGNAVSAYHSFKTSDAGASGSAKQILSEKIRITAQGDIVVVNDTKGLVLKSADGHYWRLDVDNAGVITTSDLGTSIPN